MRVSKFDTSIWNGKKGGEGSLPHRRDDRHLVSRYGRLDGNDTGLKRPSRSNTGQNLVTDDLAQAGVDVERAEQSDADGPDRKSDHEVIPVLAQRTDEPSACERSKRLRNDEGQ